MTMRLGLMLKPVSLGRVAPATQAYPDIARAAEHAGYHSVWAPEVRASDPFALLGWIGSHTTDIALGCGVLQARARSAVAAASGAATLNALSGGRLQLGLGTSGPQIVEGWHGEAFAGPLTHLRDCVAVIRLALAGQPVSYSGAALTLPVPQASEDVVPMALPVSGQPVPIHIAAMGRKAVMLAGEVADGWIAAHSPPEFMAAARAWLLEGAARTGRSLEGFTTAAMVTVIVNEDLALARDLARPMIAFFLGAMGTASVNFYNTLATRLGFGEEAEAVRLGYLSGDIDAAIDAVSDELADTMTVCGPPDIVRGRLAAYQAAGVDLLIAALAGYSASDQIEQLEQLQDISKHLSHS